MIKEFQIRGTDYYAVQIDGMWTIRETATGSEIAVTSDENKLQEAVINFLEREGILIEGVLFTSSEIKHALKDNLLLKKENRMLKEALVSLKEEPI